MEMLLLGQYQNEIVSKLKSVPNFLENILVRNLQSFTGLGKTEGKQRASSLWNIIDPLHFRTYVSVAKNNLKEGLWKISEITG